MGGQGAVRARLQVVLVAALAVAVAAWAAEVTEAASVARAPQRPVPPEYDLAIVRIGETLRWQGGLEELARFDVSLANRGTRAIEEAQVECRMGGRIFRSLEASRLIRPGEVYAAVVQVKGREVVHLTPGRYPVECVAAIVRPASARDAVPDNDRATGVVAVGAAPKPDLTPQTMALRDCETLGPATSGRAVCLEVTILNLGGGLVAPWKVACALDDRRAEAAGPTPLDKGALGAAELRFDPQAPGEHLVDCVLDDSNEVSESDEANNHLRATVMVRPETGAARYDLAVAGVDGVFAETRDRQTNQPALTLAVRLGNLGTQTVASADVRCEVSGTDLVLVGSTTGEIRPGEERPTVVRAAGRRLASLPPGRYETTCVAGITDPTGVVESDVANNVLTVPVIVKR